MADVRPFRGLRYNLSKVGDLASVTTPPYDVISPKAQASFYARSDFNIIRLELGLDHKGDDAGDNKYTRAAAIFEQWQRDGILVAERDPSVYVYEQEFTYGNERKVRRGYIAGLKLENWDSGVILPHEETLAKPLNDRLQLMLACHANFSPVFGLYEDRTGGISRLLRSRVQDRPAAELASDDGDEHRLWVIDDADELHRLRQLMAPVRVFIADGHHRYQTALRYRDTQREKYPDFTGEEAFNFVMMLLVEMNDPGLVVLPTHRMVRIANLNLSQVERDLARFFSVEHRHVDSDEQAETLILELSRASSSSKVFGAFGLRPDTFSILTLNHGLDLGEFLSEEKASAVRDLDVTVLHALVIQQVLGIDELSVANGRVSYTRDGKYAIRAVRKGYCDLSLFLHPPTVAQVRNVALAGDKMPQKSTYFHPKPLSGIVMNHLNGELPFVQE
ncbi:MAG: DUF1015 domain-containing protein [Chloroflexi bacterium]|nr:DUF1015 domain-containing protein [Chloroflexota bacterium]MDA8189157.1 DUF1015 domain-containing protein [Dehalococcoidales bacterium]